MIGNPIKEIERVRVTPQKPVAIFLMSPMLRQEQKGAIQCPG